MNHIKKYFGAVCAILLAAMIAMGCSAAPQEVVGTVGQAITTTCTTNSDCTGGVAPKCGSAASGICVTAGTGGVKACNYSLNWTGTSTCQCLEGDIQSCKTGAYPTLYDGIQTCTVTSSSPVTTNWGTCATASPTFYGETSPTSSVRACTGTTDCDDASDRPICADWDTESCQSNSGSKQCLWRRSTETGCNCIQYDVRACTIQGGGAGHQMCVPSGTFANDWGTGTTWQVCQ